MKKLHMTIGGATGICLVLALVQYANAADDGIKDGVHGYTPKGYVQPAQVRLEAPRGAVVYVVDTEEKRQTDAVRVPGAAVVGSYGEVVKAIFNTEEDK